jgi:hypothetical protein
MPPPTRIVTTAHRYKRPSIVTIYTRNAQDSFCEVKP